MRVTFLFHEELHATILMHRRVVHLIRRFQGVALHGISYVKILLAPDDIKNGDRLIGIFPPIGMADIFSLGFLLKKGSYGCYIEYIQYVDCRYF